MQGIKEKQKTLDLQKNSLLHLVHTIVLIKRIVYEDYSCNEPKGWRW